ncbi:MAG: hypothetical protein J3K34DRAFT_445571 [Monoraphidium minutum]|nr:MAG: hypothetical protein J3K34DRAFT_445571 [Monoraphidium minutum]
MHPAAARQAGSLVDPARVPPRAARRLAHVSPAAARPGPRMRACAARGRPSWRACRERRCLGRGLTSASVPLPLRMWLPPTIGRGRGGVSPGPQAGAAAAQHHRAAPAPLGARGPLRRPSMPGVPLFSRSLGWGWPACLAAWQHCGGRLCVRYTSAQHSDCPRP